MNLTIKLKNELVRAVVLDQYQDVIDDLKKELSEQVSKELLEKDGGFSKEALALQAKYGRHVFLCQQRASVAFVYFIQINNCRELVFGEYVDLTFTLVGMNKPHFPNAYLTDEVKAIADKASAELKEAKKLRDDLIAVLGGVKTVAELQKITNVFDPFIPEKQPKGTALVPAEALLRINELKTPKNK